MLERLRTGDCGGDGNDAMALTSKSSSFWSSGCWMDANCSGGILFIAVLAAKRLLKEGTLKLGAGGDVLRTEGSGAVD